MMKPILFSTALVKAILEGRKTETRRVIKPQPPDNYMWSGWLLDTTGNQKRIGGAEWDHEGTGDCHNVKPRYVAGDLLYVRETWTSLEYPDLKTSLIPTGSPIRHKECDGLPASVKWRPSIFMPKWASRITLRVESVGVERVQDITEEGALAEGCAPHSVKTYSHLTFNSTSLAVFRSLWDSINAKRGYSLQANPFVWVIKFRLHEVK